MRQRRNGSQEFSKNERLVHSAIFKNEKENAEPLDPFRPSHFSYDAHPPHLVNRAATETKGIEKHRFDSSRPTLSPIRDYWKESVFYAALFSLFFFSFLWGIGLRMERGERDSNGSDVVVVVANRARRPSVNQPSSNGHEAKTKGKNLCPQKVPS